MTRREILASAAAMTVNNVAKPRNVIFILSDDHRYDALGFLKAQPWLETPQLDRLATEGAHFRNAFVTTALCSPSRASILTGVYAHRHKIVDNNTAIPRGTTFFPSHLQKAGYKTAFFGKWHMGNSGDAPQPGFDQWVSFLGQGTYLPNPNGLNVNGRKVPQKGYITDELTDYALDWLQTLPKQQPYFMYLSHKAVHAEFEPAARHKGRYKDAKFVYPPTMQEDGEMAQNRPMWVRNQRNSWHGVDYPYHSELDIADYYKRYAETLMAVDDSVGRVLDSLKRRGELDSTLVVYMGDNGFAFGEHGLIDKRTAYEESMRVPLLARCPELFSGGKTIKQVVAGLDIMPTVLETCGVRPPAGLDGMSWLPLVRGEDAAWRKELLYEYYWERNFPQTPTVHAVRGDRYKFIRCQGVWDIDELYDLQEDPLESRNLIFSEKHKVIADQMRQRLFELLEQTGGMNIPLQPDKGSQQNLRSPNRSKAADFPPQLMRSPKGPARHQ
ncbi:sulfatase [uncultured Paludibaculum sp.]|uniref:sulfatase family protein n=1 Tax=uncultured Paludibaculum sp. TaxID=1765020 RepID=UPI002AABD2C9|nr:sulfatase [uncultured Paludibaculum sp.]